MLISGITPSLMLLMIEVKLLMLTRVAVVA